MRWVNKYFLLIFLHALLRRSSLQSPTHPQLKGPKWLSTRILFQGPSLFWSFEWLFLDTVIFCRDNHNSALQSKRGCTFGYWPSYFQSLSESIWSEQKCCRNLVWKKLSNSSGSNECLEDDPVFHTLGFYTNSEMQNSYPALDLGRIMTLWSELLLLHVMEILPGYPAIELDFPIGFIIM